MQGESAPGTVSDSSRDYRAAVKAASKRLGDHSLWAAVFVELGVIAGVGLAAAVTSLAHWKWWSSASAIKFSEVLGDSVPPMIGGAVVTAVILVIRRSRRVSRARVSAWAEGQETIAQLRAELGQLRAELSKQSKPTVSVAEEAAKAFGEQLSKDRTARRSNAATEPRAPRINVKVVRESTHNQIENVYLEVANTAAPADFYAELRFSGFVERSSGQIFARWDSHQDQRCRIPEGGRALIRLAVLQYDVSVQPIGQWTFFSWALDTEGYTKQDPRFPSHFIHVLPGGVHHSTASFMAANHDTYQESSVHVTIFSEPAMAGGPKSFSVRFFGPAAEIAEP